MKSKKKISSRDAKVGRGGRKQTVAQSVGVSRPDELTGQTRVGDAVQAQQAGSPGQALCTFKMYKKKKEKNRRKKIMTETTRKREYGG